MKAIAKILALGVIASVSWPTFAFELAFSGKKPDFSGAKVMKVASGVEPGTRLVFDQTVPGQVVLRPALDNETTTEARPVYRFEWQQERTAMFYELIDPKVIEQLSKRNERDVTKPGAHKYEGQVAKIFFNEGKVLQKCLPPSSPSPGVLTAYIVVSEKGTQQEVVVLPEGSVAQCVIAETKNRVYEPADGSFVAKLVLKVTD